MPRIISTGLPAGKRKAQRRQKTIPSKVGGITVSVVGRWYYGTIAGWEMKAVNAAGEIIFKRFHNGEGFKNPFDPDEAIEKAKAKALEHIEKIISNE